MNKKVPMIPPKRKAVMITVLRKIRRFNLIASFNRWLTAVARSVPRSVNIPVRWVVLTTDPEITETRAFCIPIANNKLPAKYSFWCIEPL